MHKDYNFLLSNICLNIIREMGMGCKVILLMEVVEWPHRTIKQNGCVIYFFAASVMLMMEDEAARVLYT